MSNQNASERAEEIERAVIQVSGETGSVHELGEVTDATYKLLGTVFFGGLALDELPRSEEKQSKYSPRAEIVSAIHTLIDWSIFRWLADSRLKLLKKSK